MDFYLWKKYRWDDIYRNNRLHIGWNASSGTGEVDFINGVPNTGFEIGEQGLGSIMQRERHFRKLKRIYVNEPANRHTLHQPNQQARQRGVKGARWGRDRKNLNVGDLSIQNELLF
jgi:hypothetical protein